MAAISKLSDARIKQIRGLSQRKERERSGLFFVEGIRNVAEAIKYHAAIDLLVVAPELLSSDAGRELVRHQQRVGTPRIEVTAEVLKSIAANISLKYGPQGLGAVVHQRWKPLAPLLAPHDRCWVALDSIQDPGNLGTILRTCDAAGAAGVILLG